MIVNTTAKFISATPEERKVIANTGGGTLYYFTTEAVSSTEKSGELASGETTTVNRGTWVASASQTSVETRTLVFVEEAPATLNIREFGADPNRSDNASAINAAIAALPATGGTLYFPVGVYTVKTLIEVKKPSVRFTGTGWDQTGTTTGSVLKAGANMAALIKTTSAATTFRLDTMALNGAGSAEAVLLIEGLNCQIRDAAVRQPKTAGTLIKVTGESVWLTNLRLNGANQAETTGITLNGTDATITGCKPVNQEVGIELQENSNGALITACHFTPGNTIGKNCIWMSKQGGNLGFVNNRIDNHLKGAAIQLDMSSNARCVNITGNTFFENGIENETFACVAVDTTSATLYGLSLTGNTVRSETSHLYSAFLSAAKRNGEAASNPTRISTGGTACVGNAVYAKAMYGTESTPKVLSNGNSFSSDGTTWEAK